MTAAIHAIEVICRYCFGYISTIFFLVFAIMLIVWKRTDIEILYADPHESPGALTPQPRHEP